jgi:RNA polymerase sigma-70 factor (ECF subfamily)
MADDARSDADLLVATPHEPSAFAEFYRRNERSMLLFFMRRTRSGELAADLTAEVFAAALAGVGSFRRRTGVPAQAWLYGIAGHVLSRSRRRARVEDRARKRLGMPPLELTDALVESIERLDDVHDGALALSLMDDLPQEQRDALQARVVDDREYGDIAAEMSCSEAVVRQRVSRGLSSLRARMEPPA